MGHFNVLGKSSFTDEFIIAFVTCTNHGHGINHIITWKFIMWPSSTFIPLNF